MRLFAFMAIVCTAVLPAGLAGAEDFTVSQKKKRFTPKQITAKPGDTLVFVNDDRYAHNLYSETPGFEFDVRKQMPGQKYRMKLEKSGKFEIRCVIHPRMKMMVNVQ